MNKGQYHNYQGAVAPASVYTKKPALDVTGLEPDKVIRGGVVSTTVTVLVTERPELLLVSSTLLSNG